MVRNFQIRKQRPPEPTLICRKKTGPPSSSLMKSAIATNSGESTTSPTALSSTSKMRFSTVTGLSEQALRFAAYFPDEGEHGK